MSDPAFTTEQRRELSALGLRPGDVDALERGLAAVGHYVQRRPKAEDVRDALEGVRRNAEDDAKRLDALLAGRTAAKREAAALLAFYRDRDPIEGPRVEQPYHLEPEAVLRRDLEHAHRRALDAAAAMREVDKRRQVTVSPWPVGIIITALKRVGAVPAIVSESLAVGSDLRRIVTICMAAAAGKRDAKDYDRWIKAHRESLRPPPNRDHDEDDHSRIF